MAFFLKQQPISENDIYDTVMHFLPDPVQERDVEWCKRWIDRECDLSQMDLRTAARLAVKAWKAAVEC